MKKILMLLLLGIFLISFISSQETSLGVFELNKEIELIQICSNETSLCDACNISSVKYPNSTIIISDVPMTKRTSDFNYTLNNSYVIVNGKYLVNGICLTASELTVWTYTFDVTLSGKLFTTQQAILYLVLDVFLIFMLMLSLWGAIILPFKNERDMSDSIIIGINYYKYLKVFLFYFSYLLFTWILNIFVGVSNNYLDLGLAFPIFAFLLRFLIGLMYPSFIILWFAWFLLFLTDRKIHEQIMRGLNPKSYEYY